MNDRSQRQLSLLLAIRRQGEHRCAESYEDMRGRFDALRRERDTLRGELDERNLAARQMLCRPDGSAPAGQMSVAMEQYRVAVENLQGELADRTVRLAAAGQQLELRRREFVQAMQLRKAVESLMRRQAAGEARTAARLEADHRDEAHAAFHGAAGGSL